MSSEKAEMANDKGRPTKLRRYLGYGVYAIFDASCDEFSVWLTAEDDYMRVTDAICLEPAAFRALEKFMDDVWKATGDA